MPRPVGLPGRRAADSETRSLQLENKLGLRFGTTGTVLLSAGRHCEIQVQAKKNYPSDVTPTSQAEQRRGIVPFNTLERLIAYCSWELIISGRAPGRGLEGSGNCLSVTGYSG